MEWSNEGEGQWQYPFAAVYSRDSAGRVSHVDSGHGGIDFATMTSQCYAYDGFNRLDTAWSDADWEEPCVTEPAEATQPAGGDEALAYAVEYDYSAAGRVTQVADLLAAVTSTYAYADAAHPGAVTSVADGTGTDVFAYDDAGRMVSRDVGGEVTALSWDASSNLVATSGQGGDRVYVYDASGQRVAQIQVTDLGDPEPVAATTYFGATEATDPDTGSGSTGDVSATRFYGIGGATVATATAAAGLDPVWALLFSDLQGSGQATIELEPAGWEDSGFAGAEPYHQVTRDAYMPYGASRGDGDLAVDRGWLGQYEDSSTGLTYLNARYYDPAIGRFLSPDPLMNPGDPRTLDPYRYADNNPISFTDANGLAPSCSGLTGTAYTNCNNYSKNTYNYSTGLTVQQNNAKTNGQVIGMGRKEAGAAGPSGPIFVSNSKSTAVVDRMVQLTNQWNQSDQGTYFRELGLGNFNFILREGNRAARGDKGAAARNGLYFFSSIYDAEYVGALHLLRYWASEGEHDFKVYEKQEFNLNWSDHLQIPGMSSPLRADALGNIQYGYLMADWNISQENALDASNVGGTAGRSDSYDDKMIRAGYELHALHPEGLSTEDVLAYLGSAQFRNQRGRRR